MSVETPTDYGEVYRQIEEEVTKSSITPVKRRGEMDLEFLQVMAGLSTQDSNTFDSGVSSQQSS